MTVRQPSLSIRRCARLTVVAIDRKRTQASQRDRRTGGEPRLAPMLGRDRSDSSTLPSTQARLHGRSFEPFTENHMPGKGPSLAQLFFNRSQPNTPRPSPAGSASASFVEGERERGLREGLKKKKKKLEKLSADMIRRIDVPVRINEMSVSGWLGEGREEEDTRPHPGDVPMEHIGHGDGKKERLPEVFHDEDSSPEDGHSVDGQGPGARTGVMGADGVHRQPSMSGRT